MIHCMCYDGPFTGGTSTLRWRDLQLSKFGGFVNSFS